MASYTRMTKAELIRLLNQRDQSLHQRDVKLAQLEADNSRLQETKQAGNKRPAPVRTSSWDERMNPVRRAAAELATQLGRAVTREEVLQHMRA